MIELIIIATIGYFTVTSDTCKEVCDFSNNNTTHYEESTFHEKIDQKKRSPIEKSGYASKGKQLETCPTEVTEHFYSKASGKIVICKGKFLEEGQKSRVVVVKK